MQAGLSCYEPGGALSDGFYDKSYLQVNATNLKECKATVAALQAKGAPHFECVRHWSYQDRFFLGHSKDEQCETIAATLTDGGCSKGGNAIAVECDDTDNILYLGECSNYDDNSNDEDVKDACEEIVIKYNRLIAEYVDSTQNRNTSLPLFSPGTTDGAPYQCNPPLR